MALKLKRQGLLSRLYKFTFCEDAPEDLCTFFWGLVICLLFLPVTWLSEIFFFFIRKVDSDAKPENLTTRAAAGFAMNIFVILAWVYGVALVKNPELTLGWTIGCGLAFWVLVKVTKKTDDHEFAKVIKEFMKSRKEKYCPKIDWDDKDKEIKE